jgi:hypothetical protein
MPILLTPCCDNGTLPVIVSQDDLPEIVGGNEIFCITGITPYNSCWTASYIEAPITYTGDFTFNFATSECIKCIIEGCPDCQDIPQSKYKLEDCQGNLPDIITDQDLSSYLGRIVKLANCYFDICWIVSETEEPVTSLQVAIDSDYKNCFKCLYPDQDFELERRSVKPGFNTGTCSPEYVTKVKCNNADAVYDQMVSLRYGITVCCETDPIKWEIKKELVELDLLHDDRLCKCLIPPCCPPTCLVVEIEPNNLILCLEPTDISVEFLILPCPDPTDVEANIVVQLCPDPTSISVNFQLNSLNPGDVIILDPIEATPIFR